MERNRGGHDYEPCFQGMGDLRESRHLQNLSRWVCQGLHHQSEASNGGYILHLLPESQGMRLYKAGV